MATMTFGRRPSDTGGPRWLERFRAADAFVVAAWEAAAAMPPGTAELSRRLRQTALDCGTCLVAAAHRPTTEAGRVYLDQAAGRLMEARYLLYLARRFGAVDSKRYRNLSTRLDRASRDVAPRASPQKQGT
jgi:hypothetical protein